MTEVAGTPPGTEPVRVLVVDDQELFRRGLIMLLSGDTEIVFGRLTENVVVLGASALLITRELGLSLSR